MSLKHFAEIQYYKYLYYRLKRVRFKDYIFIDAKTSLFLIGIFLLNFWLFFSGKTDLYFPDRDTEIYIIEILLRTTSIFIGISFSFVVLSFNVFYRYFGRFVFLSFFRNRSIKVLFTLFVSSIALMSYSLGYLREIAIADSYAHSLLILSIALSSATVFAIFPTAVLLLRESQNRKNIKTLINELNVDWIVSYHQNVLWDKSKSYEHYQKDPITLLTEIGIMSIKEFDQVTLDTIISTCLEYMDKSIQEDKNENIVEPKNIYDEFRDLFLSLFQVAAKERNERALYSLIRIRFDLETKMTEKPEKILLADYNGKYSAWSINFDAESLFSKAIQFNEDEACRRIIESYSHFIYEIIKSILPARNFDYNPDDRFSVSDDSEIFTGALRIVDTFFSIIIQTKKYYLFSKISSLYSTLDAVIVESKNTKNSKVFMLNVVNNYKQKSLSAFIANSDIRVFDHSFYPFRWTHRATDIDCSVPFRGSLMGIDKLFASDKLSYAVLNDLRADTWYFLRNIDKSTINKKLIFAAVTKFNDLRSKIKEDDSDYKKDVYLMLEKQMTDIQYYANEIRIKEGDAPSTDNSFYAKTANIPEDIIIHIESNLALFNFKDQFKNELDSKGYISDDSII